MSKTLPSFFGHDLMWGAFFTAGHFPDPATFGTNRFHDSGVSWNEIHKGPGQFNWTTLDKEVALLPGKKPSYCLSRTPQWASMRPSEPGPCGGNLTGCGAPPVDVDGANAHWKEFITALATRYKGRFDYEGWNEANGAYKGSFWSGTIPQLVRMQSDAYAIIKSIDGSALVGGPSVDGESNQFGWLDGFLSAGGGKFQDAVTFHAYLHDLNPDPSHTLVPWLAQFRALMSKHGISAQELWQTEGSWAHGTLGAGPLTPEQQAAYTQQSMILGWSAGVSRWVHYSYDNVNSGTLWNGTLLPAGKAYAELYGWLVGAERTQPAAKASDGTWTVGLTLADGTPATISWKPGVKPILTTHGGTVGSKTLSFPVPNVPVTFLDQTSKGVNLAQNGDSVTITDGSVAPPVVTKVSVSGPASVPKGATAQFTAVCQGQGAYNPNVIWSCLFGTIDQTGKYTAPNAIEVDTVTAKSVQTPAISDSVPVSITGTSGRTQIFPSGGNDSAAVVAAAAKGPIELSINPTSRNGTFNFGPNTKFPAGFDVLQDDGTTISDWTGYGVSDRMIIFSSAGGKWTGSGGPNAGLITMPNCYAKNIGNPDQNVNQYNHGMFVDGGSDIMVSGMRFTKCGGDGFYMMNCKNVSFINCDSRNNIRNPGSVTNNVDGFLIQGCFLGFCNNKNAGIAATDVEPNKDAANGPCVGKILSCQLMHNTNTDFSDGLRLSIENLLPSARVDIEVSMCQASGNSSANYKTTVPNKPSGWKVYGHGNLDNGQPTNFPN